MRKIWIVLLVALALPTSAAAKEIGTLDVCGVSGCNSLKDSAVLRVIGEGSDGSGMASVPAPAPYYRLVYHVQPAHGERFEPFTFTTYYVPGAQVVRTRGEGGTIVWDEATQSFVQEIDRLASGLEPYPRPRFTRAFVGGKRAQSPSTYAKLITIAGEKRAYVDTLDWVRIRYRTSLASPWSGPLLRFSHDARAIQRGNELIGLDRSRADQIAARAPVVGSTGGGFPWPWVVVAAAAAVVLAAGAFRVLRRSHAVPGAPAADSPR